MVDAYSVMDVSDTKRPLLKGERELAGPIGMFNNKNSCYSISGLQCALATRPLSNLILSRVHKKGSCTPAGWCICCQLALLFSNTQLSKVMEGEPIDPRNITSKVTSICSRYVGSSGDEASPYAACAQVIDDARGFGIVRLFLNMSSGVYALF